MRCALATTIALPVSLIRNVQDVVDWRMCLGCGACAYICPENRVQLRDFLEEGIRPVLKPGDCSDCSACVDVCPAVRSDFRVSDARGREAWGPIVEMWEGHANDAEIRFKGSSGGVLTAIGAYCVEVLGMGGVLHIGQDVEDPLRNRTRLSRSREEMLAASGSRYSPASVCNGLGLVEQASAPCVVMGKPSEISAVANARRLRPKLDERIGLTLSFFCAESPSSGGTVALLDKMKVSPTSLSDLRYRGLGWPGYFAPTLRGDSAPCAQMTYEESWAFLQAHRPWSVQLWPDGTGELADISCGDPWYDKPDGKNPGSSLVVARTEQGRRIVRGAIDSGYLTLTPAELWKLDRSQSGLRKKKGAVWGRLLAMRLLRLPTPKMEGLRLFKLWRQLSTGEKLRSTLGTLRRCLTRKLYKPLILNQVMSVPVKAAIFASETAAPGHVTSLTAK